MLKNMKFSFQGIIALVLFCLLALNTFSIVIYQFTSVGNDFYHEAAYPYFYAQSGVETKTIYTSQFSGREIAPISWPLINQILISLGLKLNFVTVAISNSLFLMFAISVIIYFARTFQLKLISSLLLLVLFTTVFGDRPFKYAWFDQVWIWPMNSYGLYEIFSLILCIASYKIATQKILQNSLKSFLLQNKYLLLPFYFFGLNHSRGLFEIYGPVFFGIFVLAYFKFIDVQRDQRKVLKYLLTGSLIYTFLGRLTIEFFSHGVAQVTQQPSQTFTTLDGSNFLTKTFSPFLTIFQVFGLNPKSGVSILTPHGVRMFTIFFLVIVLIIIPSILYLKPNNFRKLSFGGKFMFLHFVYFIFLSFITSIFTSSSGQVRYSIPLAISGIFLMPFIFTETLRRQMILFIVVVFLIVPSVANGFEKLVLSPGLDYHQNSNYKLTKALNERDLTYGYAGPWVDDVLAIPFYSGGRIHISVIEPDTLGPHGHGNKLWFLPESHSGETFLAIPTSNIPNSPRFQDFKSISSGIFTVDKWTVLVFQENPANLVGQLK
jgi:hypothetical protein